MSDSMPSDWEQTNLGSIATLGGGTTPSKSEPGYWEGGSVPWATPSDITSLPSGEGRIRETEIAVTTRALRECSLPLNPPGTVLMTSRATIGYAAINDVPMTTNQGFIAFRCNEKADPHFVLQWLIAKRDFLVSAAGGSTFKELGRGTAKLLPILLPPVDEQKRIGEVLRSVDETYRIHEEVLRQLHEMKAAAIEHFMIEAAEAGKTPLAAITDSMDSGWSPDCENIPAGTDEWAVLKTSAVTWEGYHDSQNKRLPAHLQPRAHLAVQTGDILITRAGPAERTGVVAMVDATSGRRMLSDKLIRIRVDLNRAVPLAVAEMLGSNVVQAEIGRVKSGMAASQTNITQKTVANLEVPLPPLEVQHQFASSVGSLNETIKLTTAQRDRLSRLKAQLASDLLSGRVRVPA